MIAEYLDRSYILGEMREQRDRNQALLQKVRAGSPMALALLRKHQITPEQLARAVDLLSAGLDEAAGEEQEEKTAAFIPRNVAVCAFQSGLTDLALARGTVRQMPAGASSAGADPAAAALESVPAAPPPENAAPRLRLAFPPAPDGGAGALEGAFVEGEDSRYGLDGFWAKLGGLFIKRHAFNPNPALTTVSAKPLQLFVFSDWGTGLPLAQQVAARIKEQIAAADPSVQQHVVHLGDVYYTGEPKEYVDRALGPELWPVRRDQLEQIGSWSLNGNHDMYSGGHGYFETLLRDQRFLRWHADAQGNASSFFLLEDAHWQFFGLDTSWNVPSLGRVLGPATMQDYGGQNGILTPEQVQWMARVRNRGKGLVLLTHHQPASSRTSEGQHSREAVALLRQAGLYSQLDAWVWGHEHRGVVFKPRAERVDAELRAAPEFCACVGHAGVPVTAKNFERDQTKPDVLWQEDRLDASAPVYEGERVVPFGFARLDALPDRVEFHMFDHRGEERCAQIILRTGSRAPAPAAGEESVAAGAAGALTTAQPNNAKIPPGFGDPVEHPKQSPRYYPLPAPPPADPAEAGRELAVDLDWIAPGQGAVVAGTGRLCFHAVGDTGNDTGNRMQERVAEAMQRQVEQPPGGGGTPQFFYLLGDVVYLNGAPELYEDRFYRPYKEYNPPIAAIAGNHDAVGSKNTDAARLDGWALNFMGKLPKAQWYPYRSPQSLPYVYWELATEVAHVFGLYSNVDGLLDPPDGPAAQADWLAARLARVPAGRAVVFAVHHPPYSLAKSHGGCEPVGAALDACARAAQRWPDLVLSGHVHSYQRYTRRVTDWGPGGGAREIPYVVAGCGGRAEKQADMDTLRRWNGQPDIEPPFVTRPRDPSLDVTLTALDTSDPGFLLLEITRAEILCRAYRVPFDEKQAVDWHDGFRLDLAARRVTGL